MTSGAPPRWVPLSTKNVIVLGTTRTRICRRLTMPSKSPVHVRTSGPERTGSDFVGDWPRAGAPAATIASARARPKIMRGVYRARDPALEQDPILVGRHVYNLP